MHSIKVNCRQDLWCDKSLPCECFFFETCIDTTGLLNSAFGFVLMFIAYKNSLVFFLHQIRVVNVFQPCPDVSSGFFGTFIQSELNKPQGPVVQK